MFPWTTQPGLGGFRIPIASRGNRSQIPPPGGLSSLPTSPVGNDPRVRRKRLQIISLALPGLDPGIAGRGAAPGRPALRAVPGGGAVFGVLTGALGEPRRDLSFVVPDADHPITEGAPVSVALSVLSAFRVLTAVQLDNQALGATDEIYVIPTDNANSAGMRARRNDRAHPVRFSTLPRGPGNPSLREDCPLTPPLSPQSPGQARGGRGSPLTALRRGRPPPCRRRCTW